MGRILDRVSGHTEIIETLLQTRDENRVPSTLLFTGREGVGRKLVGQGWAQALLCETSVRGCGQCGSCLRVEKNQSEGFRLVEAEKNQIKIEQSREILDFLSLQSMTSHRVILIDGAELLNVQAANSLLKVLEEPPPKTVFILIAPTPKHVLPTIRSRAMKVSFHPLSQTELAAAVKAPHWAYEAAGGRVSKLNQLIDEEQIVERASALELLQWWMDDPQSYLRPLFRERIKDRQFAMDAAKSFQGFFRDLECLKWGLDTPFQFPEAKALMKQFPNEAAQELYQMALGLERELKAHRDVQLLFEEFWIRSQSAAKMAQ